MVVMRVVESPATVAPHSRPSWSGKGQIAIDNLSVVFGDNPKTQHIAVKDVTLDIPAGQFLVLLGPSGCGKSTVLNAIAGFVEPTQGRVTIDGVVPEGPGADRGMVFQQPTLFPWRTVLDNVAFGPLMTGRGKSAAESEARTFLEMVGLSKFATRYPAALSGGMQQRVGIARALANYPKVLLMDEPFGALDSQTRVMMQEGLLKLWNEFRITVIFVTHDIEEAIFLGDRVVVMGTAPGHVIADIPIELPRPREHAVLFDPYFARVKRQCMELIRVETMKAFEQQGEEK
ncbi:MAG TPA: ABC transporter ATP-binding protein [Pseudolabrys sp.]|nr:ABC transporter ATP-binding protein [Pseudolabrys sp.]